MGRRNTRRRLRRVSYKMSELQSHSSTTSDSVPSVYPGTPKRFSRSREMSSQEHSNRERRSESEGESQDIDSTTHLYNDRNACDQAHNLPQAASTAVMNHGIGTGGDGLSLSPPGQDCGRGTTSDAYSEEVCKEICSQHSPKRSMCPVPGFNIIIAY